MHWFREFFDLPQMRNAFLVALIAGLISGLLGTFITLRRMAFFADAISHGAMTGVTLCVALSLSGIFGSMLAAARRWKTHAPV